MTREKFLQRLKAYVEQFGSQKAAAAAMQISGPYLSDVLKGHREPGPKVLKAMGFTRGDSYERVK